MSAKTCATDADTDSPPEGHSPDSAHATHRNPWKRHLRGMMRTRDVGRVRHGIYLARSVIGLFRDEDDITRDMNYRRFQPKNNASAVAYRRTWSRVETARGESR